MSKVLKKFTLCFFLLLFILAHSAFTKEYPGQQQNRQRWMNSRGLPHQTLLNINHWAGWISWDGISAQNPFTADAGAWYPRGTGNIIFIDGFVWGGFRGNINHGNLEQNLRVGGQTYMTGTVPGAILPGGIPQDPNDPAVRVYRIRPDWQTVSDDELRLDAAELLNIDPSQVTQAQINAVRAQYGTDWTEWPGQLGAPYYDLNQNGQWDPGVDEPGLQNADQVIWFAMNDFDSLVTTALYGSGPLRLEAQITMWGYKGNDAVGQAAFKRLRLINKSGLLIDSMFVSQWADPDIGDYTNDFAGCDSVAGIAFAYNGYPFDSGYSHFGLPPAAMGYVLVQGPIVPSPGDTAFFNFKKRADYKNLTMTSFGYWAPGFDNEYPPFGDPAGTLQWYNLLNGYIASEDLYNPTPYRHGAGPFEYKPTKFPLNGDPISGFGDVDGEQGNFPASDRIMYLASGPFAMQPGDTQEVIIAVVGGIDSTGDHISAVEKMWTNAYQIKAGFGIPVKKPRVTGLDILPGNSSTDLRVRIDLSQFQNVNSSEILFNPKIGSETSFLLTLYDDGLHNDSLAGDGIWGNSITVANRRYPFQGDLAIHQSSGDKQFSGLLQNLTLRPLPRLQNWRVVWENGQQDSSVNPLEKVHLGFDIKNTDSLNILDRIKVWNLEPGTGSQSVTYSHDIPPGSVATNDSLFLVEFGPATGDSLEFFFRLNFDYHSQILTAKYPVVPWTPPNGWGDTLDVIASPGIPKNLLPIVADPGGLTGHHYMVFFFLVGDTAHQEIRWRLTDVTAGVIKLDSMLVLDSPNHDFPVVDGIEWKVYAPPPGLQAIVQVANRLGPLPPDQWDASGAPFHGNDVWHSPSAPSDLNRFYMSAGGGAGNIERIIRNIENADNHDFEIRFTSQGGIYLWWYDDDTWAYVPFEAWDVGISTYNDTTDDVRCLTGGYSGGTATGPNGYTFDYTDPFFGFPATDWTYLRVPIDSLGTYDKFYQDVTSGMFNYNWWSHSKEVLARLIFCDFGGANTLPETGTVIRFITNKQNHPGDTLQVIAPLTGIASKTVPSSYYLLPNYPNPFNPVTHIQFGIAKPGKVKIEIFNVLGQKVKTLLDKKMDAGRYTIFWNGRNGAGVPSGSGVYFCRLKAGNFSKTRKMILLK